MFCFLQPDELEWKISAWNEQCDETKIRASTNTQAIGKDKIEEQRLEISLHT